MIEEFKKYVSNYDMKLDGISRKYKHSFRVMNLSIKYAKLLNFNDSDIELASIIGLLHDIGRFPQYQKYHSFNDFETFDHADYGTKILFEDGLISSFADRVDDYEILRFAIKNHNKLKIEDTTNKDYIKFANMIRDVDKLDIIFMLGYLDELKYKYCSEPISDNVIDDINNYRSVNKRNILNDNDHVVLYFGFVFDINNDIVLSELKRNMYYLYKRVNNKIFDDIYNRVNTYIEERIDGNVR